MLSKTKIKYIQSLGHKKFRNETGLFIAEGPKIVKELLADGLLQIVEVYATTEWQAENKMSRDFQNLTIVTDEELQKISGLSTSHQVLAIVKKPEPLTEVITKNKMVLMLDGIQDPGNLGTIIRIADWFGISQVICSRECADAFNAKVIQSSMGSIARITIMYTDLHDWIKSHTDCSYYATALDGKNIMDMEPLREGVIIIGNESKGISDEILEKVNVKLTVPRKGHAESLNAAVATGIVLSHLVK
jgi:RNA methyltransferase, TrmH family